ncbi:hypothetical protein VWM83_09790, partial [Campylobacter coli]
FMNYIFRVSLDDLRVSGGLVLIIMAIKNLLFSTKLATQSFDSILNDPSTVRASLNGVDSGNDMANKIIQLQYDKVNFYNEDG